jgi:DNA-binding response OmpR family regulator
MTTPANTTETLTATRILLVEDDPNLGAVLQEYLELKGFNVTRAHDGNEGLDAMNKGPYGLIILDIMMPKKDGFTLAREIRQMGNQTPVIFLTARGRLEDKVEGFHAGGDDYLTKPFSMEELMLRIKAVLKRTTSGANSDGPGDVLAIGHYTFDYPKRLLRIDTPSPKEQNLTSREAELLYLLGSNLNNVVRRDLALKQIWGDDSYFNARSMDVFISKLRKYLADDTSVRLMNVHGIGYKMLVG